MSNIHQEMTEASFAEGCIDNLDLLVAAELKPFATPTDAEALGRYIATMQEGETTDAESERAARAVQHTLRVAKRSPEFAHALDRIGSAMIEHATQVAHGPGAVTSQTWRTTIDAHGQSLRKAAQAIEKLGSTGLPLIEGPAAFLETHLEDLWI
jgi:hypothetical protein